MPRTRVEFRNGQGEQLAGLLETPPGNTPIACYALFAHCFSCGKHSKAATRISRALASLGIAVLRFDFTGLGSSEGDFANTDFSSNVDDLLAAARMLGERYRAPELLVGHSLGGAAVIAAAADLPSVRAVATIAAPATAAHLGTYLVQGGSDATGPRPLIRIGQQEFSVSQAFLDDLGRHGSTQTITRLARPLLVFHSPADEIVPVTEAAELYAAADHPKSFISLDGADHLLGRREDAEYVALTLAAWASRYLGLEYDPRGYQYGRPPEVGPHEVVVTELDRRFLRGLFTTHHRWMADEPRSYGGTDLGPSPYGLLLMSLGACTSMTVRLFATHEGLPLEDLRVRLRHKHVHIEDAEDFDAEDRRIEVIDVAIELDGPLTEAQRERLLTVAGRCPVHRTLTGELEIRKRLVAEPDRDEGSV